MTALDKSDSVFTLSDCEIPFVISPEDTSLYRLDQLEKDLFAAFVDIQRQIDQCEKSVQITVANVFREIRLGNEESMQAVQLDLELLRQRIMAGEEIEDCKNGWNVGKLVSCRLGVDAEKVEKYLLQHLKVHISLPSGQLKDRIPTSMDNSLLFDPMEVRNDPTVFPFEEVLKRPRRASATLPSPSLRNFKTSPDSSPAPTQTVPAFQSQQDTGTFRLVIVASLCAVAVSILVQLLVRAF